VALLLGGAGPAGANSILLCDAGSPCSLADLVGTGNEFQSGDLTLTFGNFDAILTGSLAGLALSDIAVVKTMTGFGFDLFGPLAANDGEMGDLLVRFDVTGIADLIRADLTNFVAGASGVGAGASAIQTYEGLDLQAFVFVTGGGGSDLNDTVDLPPGIRMLRVTTDIILDSSLLAGGPGGTADISAVTQDFIIPEPTTGALGLLGLGGLLLLRRRKSRTDSA
jgi:MYXO-CTERM domain-containing protein